MSQITFRIDPALKKRIEVAALEDGRKMANFIRHVIVEYLDRLELKDFVEKAAEEANDEAR
jgi:predicted DNA-binding protein